MRKYIILLACVLSLATRGQQTISLPQIMTPSPKATMMNRFGEYPVSLYTGLVDITIPIFEININGIRVPIEFKYHASGLKYDDLPMELGYGWTLIAGGTISYSVRGTPYSQSVSGSGTKANPYVWIKDISDIQSPQHTGSGSSDNDQNRLIYINNGVKYPVTSSFDYYCDSEYDLFSYNFLNHTGQMYYLDAEKIKVPANGLDLIGIVGSSKRVVDNDGITYTFAELERDERGFNKTYYLTKILSENGADEVTFDYTSFGISSGNYVNRPVIDAVFELKSVLNPGGLVSDSWGAKGSLTYKSFFPPRLNFIKYRGGKIEFIYANATTSRDLREIRIYDNRNVLYKCVKLLKLRTNWLDGVEFRDSAGAVQETYTFGYNGTPDTTRGIDYWGYYNGASVTNGYIPNFTVQFFANPGNATLTIPGMDRRPNISFMQSGVLNKIVYPTKGYTIFEYEAHRANNQIYGGLRIKEIRNYNPDNTLIEKKWYKYGVEETGNGQSATYTFNQPSMSADFRRDYKEIQNLNELGNGGGYSKCNKIRYQYYYPFPLTSYFSSGSSVLYPEVAEYSGTDSGTNGKTVYKYTHTADELRRSRRGAVQTQKYKSNSWKNGLLLSKEVYDSSNQKIYSLTNKYSYLFASETLNLSVVQAADITGPSSEYIKHNLHQIDSPIGPYSFEVGGSLFDYSNYYISTGIPVISSCVETKDGVSITTTYSEYDAKGLPAEKQVTGSNGDNFITKYKYRYTTPIQQEQYRGSSFLSKTVTEYKDWGRGMFEPEFIKFQPTATSLLENRITYHKRDSRANPLHISKDDADQIVYLWSYNYQYPIAEIKNTTYAEVVSKIPEVTLDAIAAKTEPSAADFTTINGLRTSLPNTLITTYTYKPLVGILTVTDPSGIITYYDYDTFGRLKETYIMEGGVKKIIQSYDYHYQNQ